MLHIRGDSSHWFKVKPAESSMNGEVTACNVWRYSTSDPDIPTDFLAGTTQNANTKNMPKISNMTVNLKRSYFHSNGKFNPIIYKNHEFVGYIFVAISWLQQWLPHIKLKKKQTYTATYKNLTRGWKMWPLPAVLLPFNHKWENWWALNDKQLLFEPFLNSCLCMLVVLPVRLKQKR